MIQPQLPSAQVQLLRNLVRARLIGVERWLFAGDRGLQDFEQEADGPTSFFFDGDRVLHMQPSTELLSLLVSSSAGPEYGDSYVRTDVSENRFWSRRVGARVSRLEILQSAFSNAEYPAEFGLEFHFDNGTGATVEYVDSVDRSDTLRVCEFVPSANTLKRSVSC